MLAVASDAAEALQLAQARPVEARELAGAAAGRAHGAGDLPSASVAERALGLVALHTADLDGAVDHLTRAVRLGERAGLPALAAQARTTLAYALAATGATRRALRETEAAAPHLAGLDAARLLTQRAVILAQLGELDEALVLWRRALPVLRRHGDRLWEARLRGNRGFAHTLRGEYRPAEVDLVRAVGLADELGQEVIGALSRENLGFVAARRGDVVAALRWYDEAETQLRELGVAVAHVLRDRAELLLSARLVPEARETACAALAEWRRQGESLCAAETQLLLAEASLLDGDATAARALALEAGRVFAAQRRAAWCALAGHVALRAALADPRAGVSAAEARRVSAELERTGWRAAAAETRLATAQIELRAGRTAAAHAELERASRSRQSGTIDVRVRAWHAEALLRLASGRSAAAAAAVGRGLDLVEGHRAALGATELRASAAAHRADLADLGVRIAVESGRPRRVLAWAERGRASHTTLPPVRPPRDAQLAADLTELRSTTLAVEQAIRDGRPTATLMTEQAALEQRIRARSLLVAGNEDGARETPRGADLVDRLAARLGDRVLVELVAVDGAVHGVTLADGRARLHHLGRHLDLVQETTHLNRALRWLTMVDGAPRTTARDSARHAASRLTELLVAPLLHTIGDRPLVVVPAGGLQHLPWGALPSLRDRSVVVAPSAAAWLVAAGGRRTLGRRVLAVAGPRLPGAATEAEGVARLHPAATVLTGTAATAEAVVRAIGAVDVVHVAAHSTARSDNPLFSSIQVADGPLTVCDLEHAGSVAGTVVLSACDAGRGQERSGNEVLGLATAFLALGCRSLVAPVLCVRDAETVPSMLALQSALAAGHPPAEALAGVRRAGAPILDDPGSSPDLFTCFGAD